VENEENEYPVPNPNRMLINITRELNDIHTKKKIPQIGNHR
jgi:hypothetical protein